MTGAQVLTLHRRHKDKAVLDHNMSSPSLYRTQVTPALLNQDQLQDLADECLI